jgi:methyl-accepting chemotaxis protein
MESVSAVVEENSAATQEMAAGATEVEQSFQQITSLAEGVSAAAEQVDASTEQMSLQVDSVAEAAKQLANLSQRLKVSVSAFYLDSDDNQNSSQIQALQQAHLNWVEKLKKMQSGVIELHEDEILSAENCVLGHWYRDQGYLLYGSLPAFSALAAPHQRLHEIARQTVSAFHAGKTADVDAGIREVERLSVEVCELLDRLQAEKQSKIPLAA